MVPAAPAQPAPAPPPVAAWQRHLPNALTIARLLLAAVFVALLSAVRLPPVGAGGADAVGLLTHPASTLLVLAAGLFAFAAMTDALDGMLARKWRVVSRFGRVMDPMADKVLVLGAFVVLAGPAFAVPFSPGPGTPAEPVQLSGVAPWMAVVILARELLVTTIRGVYEADGVDFSAGPAGKAKMVVQSVAAPLILVLIAVAYPVPGSIGRWIVLGAAWGTVAVTVWSGWPYVRRAIEAERAARLRRAAEQEPTA